MGYKLFLKLPTVTAVHKVGPNDHFLGKAENSQPSTLKGEVVNVPGVSHETVVLIYLQSNQSYLGSVYETPAVRGLLSPADVSRILPQKCHLRFIKIINGKNLDLY